MREPDLEHRVAEERLRLQSNPVHGGLPPDAFFADYAPWNEIETHLAGLAASDPARVTALDLGDSLEGRTLRGLQISNTTADAPAIVVNAGQHAREWIAIASTTCLADRLVRNAEDDARIAAMLDTVRVIVVPVVNPDGYVYAWEEDRYWRKNRRPPEGVDLNRNFPVAFGGPGASNNPAAGNFHGAAAFSEPESAALRDLAEAQTPLLAWLDVHSYGQLVLYPWGFQAAPAPANAVLEPAAQTLADGLSAPWSTEYTAIAGVDLYPAAGNAADWAYGELGLYAYGLELRPDGETDPAEGFVLPPEQIVPVCDELVEGVLQLSEHLMGTEPPGAGDDGGATATAGESGSESSGDPPSDGSSSTSDTTTSSTTDALSGTAGDTTTTSGTTGTPDPEPPTPGTSSSSSGTPDPDQLDDDGGCGCRSTTPPSPLWLLVPLLTLRRRRSRR